MVRGAPMGSVLPSTDGAGCHLISMGISELCCPHCGRDARGVHHRGAFIPGAAIVTVGDPDHLTVSEAGSRGEAHWLGSFGCLVNCSTPPRGGGQYPIHTRNSPASTPPKAAVTPYSVLKSSKIP